MRLMVSFGRNGFPCLHLFFPPAGAARGLLDAGDGRGKRPGMDLPDADQAFLRDLVKLSRQRHHAVAWIDRDGTPRQTTLTAAEAVRLNGIAHGLGLAKGETLRRAAHIPVANAGPAAAPPAPPA